MVIISGPSGCGKTTLHKALLANPFLKKKLVKSISATTRLRRPEEKNGRDYIFLALKTFEQRIDQGYFLEWEKVFDNYYGTPKKHALALLHKGINVLLCIDVKGAKHLAQEFPDALKIFIKAPNMKVLEGRLRARVIVNDDLTQALETLQKIVYRSLGLGIVPGNN
jgi:guanylate kinase